MTSLRLVRHIKARPQVVLDAVTTAQGIAQWWGPDLGSVLVAEDPGESRIEITLRATSDGTDLSFTHSKLHDEETSRGHEQGWAGSLRKLEAYLAKGEAA
jgi:uncharacterized protein YndB with AHSA1/START domain